MLSRLLALCLLALLFTGSGGAALAAAPAALQAATTVDAAPGAPTAPDSTRCCALAEPAGFAETAAELQGLAPSLAPALPAPDMEAPPARAPQCHGTPALAGIERPPRAATALA